jgi:colicin import membrane protein
MKAGLTTSVILHAALIGFGLVSLSAPSAFDVADVEALPVDIIPMEEITQIQEGDKKATMNERPAPTPTEKPKVVVDAKRVGDNDVDTDKKPVPDAKPRQTETAAAAASNPEPAPKPEVKPDPKPAPEPETKTAAVPATEVAPVAEPKQEVKPDPVAETIVAEQPDAETVALPETAPSPDARPKPPQAQTAKATDHKETDKPAKKPSEKPKSDDKEFNLDDVAALLNKEKAAGGGARHSDEVASLGGEKKTTGQKLTQSEMDALRGAIQRCWNVPAGALDAENLKVTIAFRLSPAGEIEGAPEIVSGGGGEGIERAAAESARRAVLQCAPYNLPAEKYEGGWDQVTVNFDPSDMF